MTIKTLLQVTAFALFGASSGAIAAADTYLLTAPPREAGGTEADAFQPIADYLSARIGKKIVYHYSDNWLTYQDEMRDGKYDLVFDGPHFLSWRMQKLGHQPLAKLPGRLAFVVVVKKDNAKIQSAKDLVGRTVCGLAPPNLATLTLYTQFENPARQPLVMESRSFKEAYEQMLSGRCVGAVLRDTAYKNLDKDKQAAKIVFQSEGIANQAFSAGPRFSASDKAKMVEALLAPEAKQKLAKFFERYNKDKDLLPALHQEYANHTRLLKDVFGFDVVADERLRN
jgi:ABC-type phosphate/phosphonate transport system substrate-binding protein